MSAIPYVMTRQPLIGVRPASTDAFSGYDDDLRLRRRSHRTDLIGIDVNFKEVNRI